MNVILIIRMIMSEIKRRVHKLTNGELVIGESRPEGDFLIVDAPYSIYETFDEETGAQRVAVMPYEFPYLMEPMKNVSLRAFDIMWNKALSDFPQVEAQYIAATTGLMTEPEEQIIL